MYSSRQSEASENLRRFAKSPRARRLILLTIVTGCFLGCSSDPNQRKLRYMESGARYFSNRKYQEAIIQFRNAEQIDPRFAGAHYQLAQAYLAAGNSEAAYRELNETVGLDPANAEAQVSLARALIVRRQYQQ